VVGVRDEELEELVDQRVQEATEELREELEEKEERIDELESRLEDVEEGQPSVEFRGESADDPEKTEIEDLWIEGLPVGLALKKRQKETDDLDERVYALETDAIDPADILDLDGSDNDLPIQRKTAERKSGTHDLSENKYRATFIWPEFHKRAKRRNGQLVLSSWQVRNILDENDLDTNPATVRRVMQFVAEFTSEKPKKERDPEDDDNLVTFCSGENENTVRADKDEWRKFFEEQMDAATAAASDANSGSEVTR
jgi:uncharacterized protein YhaN